MSKYIVGFHRISCRFVPFLISFRVRLFSIQTMIDGEEIGARDG